MINTSNSMLYHLSNLNDESKRISYQTASGKNMQNGSENSLLHANLINLEDKLRVTSNLQLQIEKSNVVNDALDANFQELKLSLDSIKVDLMKSLNDGMDRSDKLALATNLKGIRENIVDMLNTRVDGEFIFSGSVSTDQTLIKDSDYINNGQIEFGGDGFLRKIAVQPGSYRDRGVTAYDTIFYTNSSSRVGETFTFDDGERIIDSEGYEWRMNSINGHHTTIQRYDHNGIVFHPPIELPITMEQSNEIRVDLGIDNGVAVGGEVYEFTIDGVNTYSYTAAAGDDANTIFTALQTQVNTAGIYTIDASLNETDKFSITHTADMTWTTPLTNTLGISNEIQADSGQQSQKAQWKLVNPIPNSVTTSSGEEIRLDHLRFEAKHNYFDDLNIMINALEGYSTKLEGTKGEEINDSLVRTTIADELEITSRQFDATNVGHGELGGRNKVFEVAYEKLTAQITNYNILIQENGAADLTKLAMESKSLEITYQSLYSTISKLNNLSLVNFLR